MATKTKKTREEKIKSYLQAISKLRKQEKKEKEKAPLSFCKDLEKLLGGKLEKKHYDKLLETIKASKDNIIKTLDLKPATNTTTTSATSAKPTTPTPQAKPTTSTTTNYNSYRK